MQNKGYRIIIDIVDTISNSFRESFNDCFAPDIIIYWISTYFLCIFCLNKNFMCTLPQGTGIEYRRELSDGGVSGAWGVQPQSGSGVSDQYIFWAAGGIDGTDIALESEDRQVVAPISAAELAPELNISFITHEHGDHFERETSKLLTEKGKCIFVMPSNCEEIAKKEVNIPLDRIKVAEPRKAFSIGGVLV